MVLKQVLEIYTLSLAEVVLILHHQTRILNSVAKWFNTFVIDV